MDSESKTASATRAVGVVLSYFSQGAGMAQRKVWVK
jgi:hypothetical protein